MGSVLWIKYMLDVWNLYCCLIVPIYMTERFQKQMLGFCVEVENTSNKEWKSLHALVKSVWGKTHFLTEDTNNVCLHYEQESLSTPAMNYHKHFKDV